MKPTEELKNEHEAIKIALGILSEISRRLEAGEKVKVDHLEGLLEFIRVFADRCHHGKEEGLLFPAMEKAGIPRDKGPIGVMLAEHEEGRAYVRGMAQAVEEYKKGGKTAGPDFAVNARNYAALLSSHIDKEDRILYPMGDSRFPPAIQDALGRGFEKIEEDVVGPGKHEEFRRFLHRMKNEYPRKA